MSEYILGKDITRETRVKIWFMSTGTYAVEFKKYSGPLQHL